MGSEAELRYVQAKLTVANEEIAKVRAQLAYFFYPPDHSAYANTHGAQKESTESDFLQKFYAGTA